MLLSVFCILVGICALYMYKKFKESEDAYYQLHMDYLNVMNENTLMKNKINELEIYRNDISKTVSLLENQFGNKNENHIENMINEIISHNNSDQMGNKIDNSTDNTINQKNNQIININENFNKDYNEKIKELNNSINDLQDINSLNYEKYRI